MLKQECGWFDDHNNSVGALSSRLNDDASNIQTVWNIKLGVRWLCHLIKSELSLSQSSPGNWLSIQFDFASDFHIYNGNHCGIHIIGKIVVDLLGIRSHTVDRRFL